MRSDLHSVSTLEVWAAGTLFFSTGAVTGGLAFGVFSTAGNAADWVAAVGAAAAAAGTWVIGIGANRYAREAEEERREESRKEYNGRLATLLTAANQLTVLPALVEHYERETQGKVNLGHLLVTMDYIEGVVRGAVPQITSSLAYFPEFAGAIGAIGIAANNIAVTFEEVRNEVAAGESPEPIYWRALPILRAKIKEMKVPAEFLAAQAAADSDLADIIAERWQAHFEAAQ